MEHYFQVSNLVVAGGVSKSTEEKRSMSQEDIHSDSHNFLKQ